MLSMLYMYLYLCVCRRPTARLLSVRVSYIASLNDAAINGSAGRGSVRRRGELDRRKNAVLRSRQRQGEEAEEAEEKEEEGEM